MAIIVSENGWHSTDMDDIGLPHDTTRGHGPQDCPAWLEIAPRLSYGCTRGKGHDGPHRAGTGMDLVAVWSD